MIRKFIAGLLLTTFLVATTGFVLIQCCCDTSPKKECCRSKNSDGCKTDVSYFKLKADYQAPATTHQPVCFLTYVAVAFASTFEASSLGEDVTRYHNTGPPLLHSLLSQSRLQVFKI